MMPRPKNEVQIPDQKHRAVIAGNTMIQSSVRPTNERVYVILHKLEPQIWRHSRGWLSHQFMLQFFNANISRDNKYPITLNLGILVSQDTKTVGRSDDSSYLVSISLPIKQACNDKC